VVLDGGHPAKQCLLAGLADGEAVVPVVDWRPGRPAEATNARRPCARIASMATRAMSSWARMLPKPTYTDVQERHMPSFSATDRAPAGLAAW